MHEDEAIYIDLELAMSVPCLENVAKLRGTCGALHDQVIVEFSVRGRDVCIRIHRRCTNKEHTGTHTQENDSHEGLDIPVAVPCLENVAKLRGTCGVFHDQVCIILLFREE